MTTPTDKPLDPNWVEAALERDPQIPAKQPRKRQRDKTPADLAVDYRKLERRHIRRFGQR